MVFRKVAACAVMALVMIPALGIPHPADENPELTLPQNQVQFRKDRFGIAISWERGSASTSGSLSRFHARDWVELARASGAHYLVFASQSRDGMAMWDSRVNEWNLTRQTSSTIDVIGDLTSCSHALGVKLFLRYIRSRPHRPSAGKTPSPDTGAGLIELLTRYGKIDGFILRPSQNASADTSWIARSMQFIRGLQPASLIGTELSSGTISGYDFLVRNITPDDRGEAGRHAPLEYLKTPLEVRDSFDGLSSGKPTPWIWRELIRRLVMLAGMDANDLVEIQANPDGSIPSRISDPLHAVGAWLAENGDAVYGTRGGPVAPQSWGVTTHRANRVYVHVLDPKITSVTLNLPSGITAARYHEDRMDCPWEKNPDDSITLNLRPPRPGECDRIILLYTK